MILNNYSEVLTLVQRIYDFLELYPGKIFFKFLSDVNCLKHPLIKIDFSCMTKHTLQRRGKVKVYQVTEPLSSTLKTALYHIIVRSNKEENHNLIVKYIFWRLLLLIRNLQELIQLHANTSREKSNLSDDTTPSLCCQHCLSQSLLVF